MVNFHKKLGGDTPSTADPNWPNKQHIQFHVTSCLVLKWGGWLGQGIAAQEQAGHWAVRRLCCVFLPLCILCIIIVVILLFFCCSVKLSLSQPTSFAFSFQFCSPSHHGGRPSEQLHDSLLPGGAKP